VEKYLLNFPPILTVKRN